MSPSFLFCAIGLAAISLCIAEKSPIDAAEAAEIRSIIAAADAAATDDVQPEKRASFSGGLKGARGFGKRMFKGGRGFGKRADASGDELSIDEPLLGNGETSKRAAGEDDYTFLMSPEKRAPRPQGGARRFSQSGRGFGKRGFDDSWSNSRKYAMMLRNYLRSAQRAG